MALLTVRAGMQYGNVVRHVALCTIAIVAGALAGLAIGRVFGTEFVGFYLGVIASIIGVRAYAWHFL